MEIIRKRKILVKIEHRSIAGSFAGDAAIFCEQCVGAMIRAQLAADLFGISSREIYRSIEAEKIHFFETDEKQIYVCPLSIKTIWEKNLDGV